MSKEFEDLAKFIADKGTNSGHIAEALFVLCVCSGIENLYADIGKPTAKDIIDGLKTYSKQDKGSGKVLFSRDIKIKSPKDIEIHFKTELQPTKAAVEVCLKLETIQSQEFSTYLTELNKEDPALVKKVKSKLKDINDAFKVGLAIAGNRTDKLVHLDGTQLEFALGPIRKLIDSRLEGIDAKAQVHLEVDAKGPETGQSKKSDLDVYFGIVEAGAGFKSSQEFLIRGVSIKQNNIHVDQFSGAVASKPLLGLAKLFDVSLSSKTLDAIEAAAIGKDDPNEVFNYVSNTISAVYKDCVAAFNSKTHEDRVVTILKTVTTSILRRDADAPANNYFVVGLGAAKKSYAFSLMDIKNLTKDKIKALIDGGLDFKLEYTEKTSSGADAMMSFGFAEYNPKTKEMELVPARKFKPGRMNLICVIGDTEFELLTFSPKAGEKPRTARLKAGKNFGDKGAPKPVMVDIVHSYVDLSNDAPAKFKKLFSFVNSPKAKTDKQSTNESIVMSAINFIRSL